MSAKIGVKWVKTLVGHQAAVYALAADGNGGFYSAGGDGMLVHWPEGEENGVQIAQIPDNVYALAFDSAKGLLLAGSRSGALFVLDTVGAGDKKARRIEAHVKGIFDFSFFNQGFVSVGGDGICRVWSSKAELLHQFNNATVSTRCVLQTAEGQWWLGSSDFCVRVYDEHFIRTGEFQAHEQSVFALAALPDGSILSGGRDARLRQWSAAGEMLKDIPAHWLHIHSLAVSPNKRIVGSSSMDKSIKLWDTESLELLKVIDADKMPAHRSSVNKLIWISENLLVSAGDDKQICVFEVG
jgi:WD40 repeat protein